MANSIRVALAQINPTVGDFEGNFKIITDNMKRAVTEGADIIVFPELAVCGYPPEDLLTQPHFVDRCKSVIEKIAKEARSITVIIGAPTKGEGTLRNSACVLSNGKCVASIHKHDLPNYGVFDEWRYFRPGNNGSLLRVGNAVIGVTVCEDIWKNNSILAKQKEDGANIFINLSASPYREDALTSRKRIVKNATKGLATPLVYCNLVGGQDELVFDGHSLVYDANGNMTAIADAFVEDLLVVDIELSENGDVYRETIDLSGVSTDKPPIKQKERKTIVDADEEMYTAITLGVSDYMKKNRFSGVVIALSGGIDSALTVAIAVDALGSENVHAVSMPSPHSSTGSVEDSQKLADNLHIKMDTIAIGDIMKRYDRSLDSIFRDTKKDVTEENIQARIRAALVMALSNKFGWITLATGNKSEIAVGYCTLYGDMVGGFAVLKDVFKTKVYALSRWRNKKAGFDIIPNEIIEKPPSAELSPGQFDTDSLPPYDVLDPILKEYIENSRTVDEIEKLGYSRELALRVVYMVDNNEYKRRQGPIGVKLTTKSFGRDRRHPITNRFIEK